MSAPLFIAALRFAADSDAAVTAFLDFRMTHRLVYSGFATKEAATRARVLFRFDLEGEFGFLYVQSSEPPDWSGLPRSIAGNVVGPLPMAIPQEDRLQFRLLAKPSYRVGNRDDERIGKRSTISDPAKQIEWLRRKGATCGFEVEDCLASDRIWHDSGKARLPNGELMPLHAVQFDGILRVADREKLEAAVRSGIGPQKAFGFGLLSLAALRE
ncbi:MAG: type I-E CRISPR-associated protein Cas6/Cse3/CasE [Fimbriimonadaceae bacterium]|nr:type I-E CRISPR-associated protein Cas6/Cse3/CasE [Fimbriimonadaceae bacterium]